MSTPWPRAFTKRQFDLLAQLCAAPSPPGFEASLTNGVLVPVWETFIPLGWEIHRFVSSGAVVLDTRPEGDADITIMFIAHADKIRFLVQQVEDDGKVRISNDAALTASVLGDEVVIYAEDPSRPGSYRSIGPCTIQALPAIHMVKSAVREGDKGVSPDSLYVETGITGKDRRKRLEALGIVPGASVIFRRPLQRMFAQGTCFGPYVDNSFGCLAVTEVARRMATHVAQLGRIRVLFAVAAFEELGLYGSPTLVRHFSPNVVVGVDVNHDKVRSPGVTDLHLPRIEMGDGFTLTYGSIVHPGLNAMLVATAQAHGIPFQRDVSTRMTGTDAMGGVLSATDVAATSIGVPTTYMHTSAELIAEADVLAVVEVLSMWLLDAGMSGLNVDTFRHGHINLGEATALDPLALPPADEGKEEIVGS